MPDSLLIDNETASTYWQEYQTATPERKTELQGPLRTFFQDQQKQQAQAQQDHLARIYSDLQTMGGWWNETDDGRPWNDEEKAAVANRQFIATQMGKTPEDIKYLYPIYRDQYASDVFKNPKVTDRQFYDLVKGQFDQMKSERLAVNDMENQALTDAVDAAAGNPIPSAVQRLQEFRAAHPDMANFNDAGWMQAHSAIQKGLVDKMGDYGPHVKSLITNLMSLEQDQGGETQLTDQQKIGGWAESLADLPPDKRRDVLGIAAAYAQANGHDPKGFFSKLSTTFDNFGKSMLRSAGAIINGASTMPTSLMLADRLKTLQSPDGYMVRDDGTVLAPVLSQEVAKGLTSAPDGFHWPTNEEKQQLLSDTEHDINVLKISRELRQLSNGQINPIKPQFSGFTGQVEGAAYMGAGMAPYVATSLVPYVGVPLTAAAITSSEFDRISTEYPDLDPHTAAMASITSGAVQAGLMKLNVESAMGKLPTLSNFVGDLQKPASGFWQVAARSAMTGAEIAGQTAAQSLTPIIIDGVTASITKDMPEYDGAKKLQELAMATPQTALAMLPFWLLGTGAIGMESFKNAQRMGRDASLFKELGASDEQAKAIVNESDIEKKSQMVQEVFEKADPAKREALIQKMDAQVQASEHTQQSPNTPTLRSVVDENGQPAWSVSDAAGNEIYRGADENAALVAYEQHAETTHQNGIREAGAAEPSSNTAEADAQGLIAGSKLEVWADSTLERIRKEGRLFTGIDPELFTAYAIKGAAYIERGIRNFSKWSKEMIAQFGKDVTPHLEDLWKNSNGILKGDIEDLLQRQYDSSKKLNLSSDEFMPNYIASGAAHIIHGLTDFKEWSKTMTRQFGGEINSRLPEIWDSAKARANERNSPPADKSAIQNFIEKDTGIKKPYDKSKSAQKSGLRKQERAGEAGYNRGIREARREAQKKITALKKNLDNAISKDRAIKEYIKGFDKGKTEGTATEKARLQIADKWLSADQENNRRFIVDYINFALPVSERGRFLTLATKALERPGILGNPEKLYRAAEPVIQAVEARALEVYRGDLAGDIRKVAARALNSPSVDVKAKTILEKTIEEINLKNPSESTLEKLKKTREHLEKMAADGKDVEMPGYIFRTLEQLAKTPLDELPTATLEDIHNRMLMAEKIGRSVVKGREARWIMESNLRTAEILNGPSEPLQSKDPIRAQPGEKNTTGDQLKNFYAKVANIVRLADSYHMPMDVIFDMLQGGKGSYAGPLFDHIRTPIDAAFDRAMRSYGEAREGLREIISKNKLGTLSGERIGLWAALQQSGGEARALESGVTQATIDKLKSEGLTAGEKEAYDYMRGQLDGSLPAVQETMRQLYNISVEPVKGYFPWMREWETYRPDNSQKLVDPISGEQVSADELSDIGRVMGLFSHSGQNKLQNGFTLERKPGAGTAIRFDSFSVFERHMLHAYRLIEMQRAMKMAGQIINSKEFGAKFGNLGQKMLQDWITITANDGGGQSVHRWRGVDALNRGLSRSLVFFNPVSNIKHASAIPMGMVNAGGSKYWWMGLNAIHSEAGQKFLANFPQVLERQAGELSVAQFQKLVDDFKTSAPAKINDVVNKTGFWVGKQIDEYNSQAVFIGRYLKNLEDKGKAADLTAPVDEQAAYNAMSFMRRTVSSALPKDLQPALSMGKGYFDNTSISKMVNAFGQFRLERWSQWRYDLTEAVKAKDYKKAAGMLGASAIAVLYETNISIPVKAVEIAAFAALVHVITGKQVTVEKPKHEESLTEKVIYDLAGMPPYMPPILAARYGRTGVPLFDLLHETASASFDYSKAKTSKGKESAKRRLMQNAAEAAGVPGVKQLLDVTKGVKIQGE